MEGGLGAGTGGQGWEMRQAGVWRTKVWASRGVGEGVGAGGGAAKVSPGEKPSHPKSILIPHQ